MLNVTEALDVDSTSAGCDGARATVARPVRPRHDVLWLAEKVVGGWAETLRVSMLVLVVVVAGATALMVVQPMVGVGSGVCATMLIVAMQSRSRYRSLVRRRLV